MNLGGFIDICAGRIRTTVPCLGTIYSLCSVYYPNIR